MIFDLFDSPELLDIQRIGFYRFLDQGIPQLLAKLFPIKVKNGSYSIELLLNEQDIKLIKPEENPRDCILKMKTYSCKLYVQIKIVCKKSSGKIVYQSLPEWVLLGQLPMMTKRGHFIINGSPRVIVHQVVRSPGIYFQKLIKRDDQNRARFYGDIIPLKGVWVRLQMTKKGRVEVKFKKGKKVGLEFLQKCLQVIEDQSCYLNPNGFSYEESCAPTVQSLYRNKSSRVTSFPKRRPLCFARTKESFAAKPLPFLERPDLHTSGEANYVSPVLSTRKLFFSSLLRSKSYLFRRKRYKKTKISSVALANRRFAGGKWLLHQRCQHEERNLALWSCFLSPKVSKTKGLENFLEKRKSRSESKAENDAFIRTYDKLYRTTQDKELEEWQKKKKNVSFLKGSSAYKSLSRSLPSMHGKNICASTVQTTSPYKTEICACKRTNKTKNVTRHDSLALPKGFDPLIGKGSTLENAFKRKKCSENLFATFKMQSRYDLGRLGREKIDNKFGCTSYETNSSTLGFVNSKYKAKLCNKMCTTFALLSFTEGVQNQSTGSYTANARPLLQRFANLSTRQNFVQTCKENEHLRFQSTLLSKKNNTQLTSLDLCSASLWLHKLRKGEQSTDDIDHSQNRRVRTSGELLQTQFENGVDRLKTVLSTKLQEWRGGLHGSSFASIFKTSYKTRYNPKFSLKRSLPFVLLPFTEGVQNHCKPSVCTASGKTIKKVKLSYAEMMACVNSCLRSLPYKSTHKKLCPLCKPKVCNSATRRFARQLPTASLAKPGFCKKPDTLVSRFCKGAVAHSFASKTRVLQGGSWLCQQGSANKAVAPLVTTPSFPNICRCFSKKPFSLQKNILTNLLKKKRFFSVCTKQSFVKTFLQTTSYKALLFTTFVTQHARKPQLGLYNSNSGRKLHFGCNYKNELPNLGAYKRNRTSFMTKSTRLSTWFWSLYFAIAQLDSNVSGFPNQKVLRSYALQNKVENQEISYKASTKELFSTKPITGALREFFGSNPLSQYMDQTNPLAEITHKRRISSLGVGGVSRESAGMAIRGIHPTHYGRICPIETPEGKNAGLVNSLAFYTKVDINGFLKTPYYRVFKGQIQSSLGFSFCSAKEESQTSLQIAPSDLEKSLNNVLRTRFSTLESVPVRVADNLLDVFKKENPYKVELIAISPIQMISVATSLIPFLEHNDANRALMGSNMQRQAVPLMISERPIVGTGLESNVIIESGHVTESQISGFVSHVSANLIVVDRLSDLKQVKKESCSLKLCRANLRFATPKVLHQKEKKLLQRHESRASGNLKNGVKSAIYAVQSLCDTKLCKSNRFLPPASLVLLSFLELAPLVQESAPWFWTLSLPLVLQKQNKEHCKSKACTKVGFATKLRSDTKRLHRTFAYKYKSSYKPKVCTCKKGCIGVKKKFFAIKKGVKKKNEKQSFLLSSAHSLTTFSRSNQNTCITEKPLLREFDWVQKGDVLSDCSASNNGELAVGKNVLVAYIPWEGYNFEDAIVISDRLVREHVYTSLHIERYVFQAQDLKDGNEWFTKQLPGVESRFIQHLEESGLPKVGSFLKEGDIIVGKIRYLNKKPASPYERLLCDILGEKNFAARNKSLYVPKGVEARVIYHKVINRFDNDLESQIRPIRAAKTVHLFLGEKRVIQVGDKISGRHGNKGVISTILPRQDMPYLPDGTPIDIILNPLGVPSRMNVGQVLESLLGLAALYLNQHFKIAAFDERYGVEASKSVVFLKLYQARLQSGQNWLFQVSFPGKTRLIDGRSGECFDQWITVGKAYILKLIHMVSEKIHARSTGPYALITQQPLRGRSNKGGQRLGEMEVWALEGFGAAYTLQELLTKKSDDFFGRKQIVDSILPNPSSIVDVLKPNYRINQSRPVLGHPEIFKVLLCELQALCLDLGVYIVTPESFQRSFLGVVH